MISAEVCSSAGAYQYTDDPIKKIVVCYTLQQDQLSLGAGGQIQIKQLYKVLEDVAGQCSKHAATGDSMPTGYTYKSSDALAMSAAFSTVAKECHNIMDKKYKSSIGQGSANPYVGPPGGASAAGCKAVYNLVVGAYQAYVENTTSSSNVK